MTKDRESVSLAGPPDDPAALRDFPAHRLSPATALFRVTRIGKGPWWFGSSMAGRFDLPEPDGTCYTAADPVAALVEVVGPELVHGLVSAEFLRGRRMTVLHVPAPTVLSDMTTRKASGFGITAEIGSITPYDLPQAWAARLRAAGSHGIFYWLRHDPSRGKGFALFGLHGERADWPWETEDPEGIPLHLIVLLEEVCGIQVLEIPRRDHLRVIGD